MQLLLKMQFFQFFSTTKTCPSNNFYIFLNPTDGGRLMCWWAELFHTSYISATVTLLAQKNIQICNWVSNHLHCIQATKCGLHTVENLFWLYDLPLLMCVIGLCSRTNFEDAPPPTLEFFSTKTWPQLLSALTLVLLYRC